MVSIIHKLLEQIFPVRDSYTLVQQATSQNIRHLYCKRAHAHCITLSEFNHPLIRACIHETKYRHNVHAASLLSVLLRTYIDTLQKTHLIIPIPLSNKRKRKRSYNQVAMILQRTQYTQTHKQDSNILMRTRDTQAQTTLNKEARLKNMNDAFICKADQQKHIAKKHILLVDDVITTGATLHAAKAALLPHSTASITCVALAH